MTTQTTRWCAALLLLATSTSANSAVTFSFGASTAFDAGLTDPVFLVTGDFNGDGYPDIATIGTALVSGGNTGSVLLGNGDGTFKAPQTFAVDGSSRGFHSLAAGDLNNDHKLDLVVANDDTKTLSILIGNGDGTFASPVRVACDCGSTAIAVSDINSDGKSDVVAIGNSMQVFLGNGDGTFHSPISTQTPAATDLRVIDLNGDHVPDIALASYSTLEILTGHGDGTFQTAFSSSYPFSAQNPRLAVGDVNGDSIPDVIIATLPSTGSSLSSIANVFLGNGDGTFKTSSSTYDVGELLQALSLVDLNGDGNLDLVSANQQLTTSGTAVNILAGNGDGTFQIRQPFIAATVASGSTAINDATSADLNDDGIPDIVAASFGVTGGGKVDVLMGTGTANSNSSSSNSSSNPASAPSSSGSSGGGGGGSMSPEILAILGFVWLKKRYAHPVLRR